MYIGSFLWFVLPRGSVSLGFPPSIFTQLYFVNNEMNASWQLRCDPGEIYEHKAERRAVLWTCAHMQIILTYPELRSWDSVDIASFLAGWSTFGISCCRRCNAFLGRLLLGLTDLAWRQRFRNSESAWPIFGLGFQCCATKIVVTRERHNFGYLRARTRK